MTQKALSRQNGAFMKIILIGANGTIGELVQTALASTGHEIVKVGRKSGDFQVDIESRENIRQFYQAIGPFDAVAAAAAVSGALEGFARAAAVELPKGLRINVVSPTILKESEAQFGPFFPGVIPVEGWRVEQAYKRAILGAQTGRVYKVD